MRLVTAVDFSQKAWSLAGKMPAPQSSLAGKMPAPQSSLAGKMPAPQS